MTESDSINPHQGSGSERAIADRKLPGDLLARITARGACDLHLHSTASDGSQTPLEVSQIAENNGLIYYALTDHDTVSGVLELMSQRPFLKSVQQFDQLAETPSESPRLPPILIPGVELSVMLGYQNIHLLAYYFGHEINHLQPYLNQRRLERRERNERLVQRLRELNFDISLRDLVSDSEDQVTGRVKAAQWLLAQGHVSSINEAFQRWLADGKPGFVPKKRVEFADAIELIRATGGFAVIAHPHQYGWCENGNLLQSKLSEALQYGEVGVEAYHSDATLEQQLLVLDIARKIGLTVTAGSDCHGKNKEAHAMYSRTSSPKNHYSKI